MTIQIAERARGVLLNCRDCGPPTVAIGVNMMLQVQEAVSAHPGVVGLVLFGGDGRGGYGRDARGVHHLSPCAAVGCDVNEDAFGFLQAEMREYSE